MGLIDEFLKPGEKAGENLADHTVDHIEETAEDVFGKLLDMAARYELVVELRAGAVVLSLQKVKG